MLTWDPNITNGRLANEKATTSLSDVVQRLYTPCFLPFSFTFFFFPQYTKLRNILLFKVIGAYKDEIFA